MSRACERKVAGVLMYVLVGFLCSVGAINFFIIDHCFLVRVMGAQVSEQIAFFAERLFAVVLGTNKGALSCLKIDFGLLTCSLIWILRRPALEYRLLQLLKVQAKGFWPV